MWEEGASRRTETVRRRPREDVRRAIAWYHGYRQAGLPPARHRGLPSPHLTLIFTLDDPLVLASHPDPRQPAGAYASLVGGLHTAPAVITHDGRQSGIQLALNPLGARDLLGLPAGELAGLDLHASEVLGSFATELRERLVEAPSWTARFAVLDDLLGRRLDESRTPPVEVAEAYRLLVRQPSIAVADVARLVGWSGRHLAARLRAEVGLPPRVLARVVRFDRARRLVRARDGSVPPTALADIAAECGYYDQAHLTRDFREFAGTTPTRWFAEEAHGDVVAPVTSQVSTGSEPSRTAGVSSGS